ncbi:MAG TPA: hypothetical protein VF989_17300, partial [Polyangiaceae bacterium]
MGRVLVTISFVAGVGAFWSCGGEFRTSNGDASTGGSDASGAGHGGARQGTGSGEAGQDGSDQGGAGADQSGSLGTGAVGTGGPGVTGSSGSTNGGTTSGGDGGASNGGTTSVSAGGAGATAAGGGTGAGASGGSAEGGQGGALGPCSLPAGSEVLVDESFDSDVFLLPRWTRTDTSVSVAGGLLVISADESNDDYADLALLNQPMPIVIELRERVVSGGQSYRFVTLEAFYSSPAGRVAAMYYEGVNAGWQLTTEDDFTGSVVNGPSAEGEWSTLRLFL